MITHHDWATAAFDLAPVAPRVGPFPGRDWLQTWWSQCGSGELMLADTGDGLVTLTLTDNLLEFAGEADLTDYHSPLGPGAATALAGLAAELPSAVDIRLDSLPHEAAVVVGVALESVGLATTTTEHTVAAVLSLPDSFDDYLAQIGKKERHELRRKRRRFDNELGTATLVRQSGPEAVATFADLHRRSSGDKGEFMTANKEQFFLALHNEAGGVIDFLLDGSGQPASAVFSFEDDAGFYLYNSAFEPDVRHLSPGNVVLSHLIERSISERRGVFDFLKGDETYKFRLGAVPRPLFIVSATTGAER
ncbi:MAG: GNAT family N-acetyltransferase [Actinomycetota bacterium]|nr:GNAT family N-acetyltransferase [Actinomycetota bacterium]